MTDSNDTKRRHSQQPAHTQLPVADAELQAHSERLQQRIRAAIDEAGGRIGFEQFMHMALYEPGLGYYSAGLRKFGADGDFITAPEVSPLFGRCLARFCREAMASMTSQTIVEFGAGSGRMAADILAELDALEALPSLYQIIEVSAELRQRQRQTLQRAVPHLLDRVQWLQTLPAQRFSGVVLANELLDAMPVRRFIVDAQGLLEIGVGLASDGRGFETVLMPADDSLHEAVQHIQRSIGAELAQAYSSEWSPARQAWVRSVADWLEQGVVLLVDYGYGRSEYYHPARSMGTLMCHYRHRAHDDALALIGLQDITSYVDFTAIAEAAVESGLQLSGYTTQCGFLLENGLEQMMPDPAQVSEQQLLAFAQQVKTLTLPGEMGERFKVMALSRDVRNELSGFRLQDQRGRL